MQIRTLIRMIPFVTILLKKGFSFQKSFFSSHSFLKSTLYPGTMLLSRKEVRQLNRLQCTTTEETPKAQTINLKGVKNEITRAYLRSIKKMGKLNERLQKFAIDSPSEEMKTSATTSEYQETLEREILELESRINDLKHLEDSLSSIKSANDPRLEVLLPLIIELKIPLSAALSQDSTAKKERSKALTTPRKPYFVYRSFDGIEIWVGRKAEDNDELSCNPEHRHPNEWWLHVAGFAGSHVVIKSQEDNLPEILPETVIDAALLAAVNSKAKNSGRVSVSLTRCKNVTKPKGVPAGIVHLSGSIRSVTIDLRSQSSRLERLQRIQ